MNPTDDRASVDAEDAGSDGAVKDPLVDAVGGADVRPADARKRSAITGHDRHGQAVTDGGEAVSQFEQTAEFTMSKGERRRQWLEEKLLAPARIVWSDWRARTGLLVVSFYLLMGIVGPHVVAAPSPNQGRRLLGAFRSLEHPFGTTASGVDLLSQTVHATPAMLLMLASGAVFSVVLGTAIGTTSGYKGGRFDSIAMTINDMAMTIPGLPLTIVLASVLQIEGHPIVIGILITINAWAGLARAIRSQVLTLRESEYVEASRIMGISTPKIVLGDIVPNLMPYITMNFVQQARMVIFGSVGLYFLGVLPYTSTNWGVMMDAAVHRAGATSSLLAIHWLLVPMFTVIALAFGLTLLAQGADRIFNPRVRARHAETIEGEGEGGDGDPGDGTSTTDAMEKNAGGTTTGGI
ncbi:ABC transporter permease [Halorhabdus amylolytica]|uniref:ABC transporter permease n=1 Tax=Halorhabdus amylolytica TaxID=2559573 RepID=UPI0010A9A281|nr:ABC transporter permease [Halorhabdus amylolytica]